jgi:hypothetical protein
MNTDAVKSTDQVRVADHEAEGSRCAVVAGVCRVVLSILVYPANARKVAVADPGALDWLITYPDTVAVR